VPRRLQCQRPSRREDIGGEGIEDEGLCAPSKANEPCHRSAYRRQSLKVKTSARMRHSGVDASGLRTCIG